ncbi:pirin family protein [Hoyosella subflava]|uniref:Pirin domain protein n=1 Tax=Hoyosella subflava (strain DSM 45089 / JCM 17490 / NBRC 109087 / DQS3-9A1) TaxID=443218 RepID=F6ELP2_HOYSD|nr:pirin family protein [Hoyosella subflava]AEF41490.1 Pirin domain protein [Hoyosella subflava DQS3-9A1]
MDVQIKRADERTTLNLGWLVSKHTFPFAGNFDLHRNGHGVLLVNNEDVMSPGESFDMHQHKDMEIVTWVMSGEVVHEDSTGNTIRIPAGSAQRMTAGTGIRHAERSVARNGEKVHVVQMWAAPDTNGLTPHYDQADFTAQINSGELFIVASGLAKHADEPGIGISNKYAALYAARIPAGQSVTTPTGPFVHVFVAEGEVHMDSAGDLSHGDSARITNGGGQTLTAREDSEILIWEMHAHF